MSETPVENAPETPQEQPAAAEDASEAAKDSTDWKAEARKWEQRAKENSKATRDLEAQRQASMTEAERAIAEAEQRGRTAATTELGKRLARSSFEAAAARRNPDYDSAALDFLDLSRFVGEDGEPDAKAITTAVERLVPAPSTTPSFDGGARTSAGKASDMNSLMRAAMGRQ